MKQIKYKLVKELKKGNISGLNNKMTGFRVTPQNNVEYPGIEVNSMLVIKNTFIEKLLKKKTKRKLDYYLQYIINIIESDDETSTDDSSLRQALNDLTRYKEIIEYKYRKYLDDKYIDILLKKIALIEGELKSKIIYKTFDYYASKNNVYEDVEEKGKSR